MNFKLTKLLFFTLLTGSSFLSVINVSHAGPYPPAADIAGTTAIASTNSNILGWASGYSNYNVGSNVDIEWQISTQALGPAGNSNGNNNGFAYDIVSLGRGGDITLTFDTPITNGSGADFAIFENAFSNGFLELAWVEVSSNGVDFSRFSSASLTPTSVGSFNDTMDATNIDGLAGKYRGGFGTPFDLSDLANNPLVDITQITHIRIIDIVGDGSANDELPDAVSPAPIYDPYPTSGSAGFDLDAVAVMHFAEPVFEQNVPFPIFYLFILGGLFTAVFKRSSHSLF